MQICFMVYFAGQLISHWEVSDYWINLVQPLAKHFCMAHLLTPFPYSIFSVFEPIAYLRRRRVWATADEEWDGGLGSCLVPGFVAPLP